MPEIETPTIRVYQAIAPSNSGTGESRLIYGALAGLVEEYGHTNGIRTIRVWEAEAGSLEELASARQLASEYLLDTAEKLVESGPHNRDLWADRYTQASIELYGGPDANEAIRLLSKDYDSSLQLRGNSHVSQRHLNFLLDTFKPIAIDITEGRQRAEQEAEQEKAAIKEYGGAILEKYKPLFDIVDQDERDEFGPNDLVDVFKKVFDWLKEHDDPEWEHWQIELFDRSNVSHSSKQRKLLVGDRRQPATSEEVKGLVAHEILVHCMRVKNGYKTSDIKLATGLPGYLDAEEGLGVLTSEAVTGRESESGRDFYIDIALALGLVDGLQRNRQQLFEIVFARNLIRGQLEGKLSDHDTALLVHKAWSHVDRIYRGGPGDNLGTRQAIFTKDISYYVGYKQMAKYIKHQLELGESAAEVFEYLSLAAIDPTNDRHAERLEQVLTTDRRSKALTD